MLLLPFNIVYMAKKSRRLFISIKTAIVIQSYFCTYYTPKLISILKNSVPATRIQNYFQEFSARYNVIVDATTAIQIWFCKFQAHKSLCNIFDNKKCILIDTAVTKPNTKYITNEASNDDDNVLAIVGMTEEGYIPPAPHIYTSITALIITSFQDNNTTCSLAPYIFLPDEHSCILLVPNIIPRIYYLSMIIRRYLPLWSLKIIGIKIIPFTIWSLQLIVALMW